MDMYYIRQLRVNIVLHYCYMVNTNYDMIGMYRYNK